MSEIKVNELTQTETIDTQTLLVALTNFENNTVGLATVETLLNNSVSDDNTNSLTFKDGKLYVNQKGLKPVKILSGTGTVTLESNTINRVEITGALEFILPEPTQNVFNQILVQVSMPELKTTSLGTAFTFNNELPALTEAGNYNLIYEHDGTNWYLGIIKKDEVS